MKIDVAPPRGTRDLLPDEVERRDAAVGVILDTYRAYGFRRIETPALESLRLLTSGEGGENEKLIFKILKRGEKLEASLRDGVGALADLGLRFDLTVPLARYYAHNHAKLPSPFKAIQIGPVWRAERPQRGRYRQFTQCDIDVLGLRAEVVEIELILATCDALLALGVAGPTVRLNDRRVLAAVAAHCGVEAARREGFFIAFDKLDKIGAANVLAELRAAGHAPATLARFEALLGEIAAGRWDLDGVAARLQAGPEAGSLRGAVAGLRTIIEVVAAAGSRHTIRFDPTLVRGMGYYTGPIFEVAPAAGGSSLAGGGRYDRMVGKLLGREVPACGFSIGLDRLLEALEEAPPGAREPRPRRIALLFDPEADAVGEAVARARALRAQGDVVSIETRTRNLGRRLAELEAHGFTHYGLAGGGAPPELKPLHGARAAR